VQRLFLTLQLALFGLAGLVAWTACGNEPNGNSQQQVRRVFVHGSPEILLRGTSNQNISFLESASASSFAGFDFSSGIVLSEFSPLEDERSVSSDVDSAVARAARLTQNPTGLGLFSWQVAGTPSQGVRGLKSSSQVAVPELSDQTWLFADSSSGYVALKAKQDNSGRLAVTEILGIPVDMVHYSITPDRRTMSFLGRTKDQTMGSTLVAASFSQRYRGSTPILRTSTAFSFLAGKGIPYRWQKQTIELSLCLPEGDRQARLGADTIRTESIHELVQEAWQAWIQNGRVGERPAAMKLLTQNVPPFSDVNTHCVYSVPEYAHEASQEVLTAGLTLPMVNHSLGTIESASVFLFEQAIARIPGERSYLSTAIHEIGHFLGLGHEFDKDADGRYRNLSAMAYAENRTVFPTEHDRKAVQELYGRPP
jgi:hypothetical protein